MKLKLNYIGLLACLLFVGMMTAQEVRVTARGNSIYRRVGTHNGNQVRTVFSNYGVIAQPSTLNPRGAWKYDNNGYVGDVSPVIGVQLPIRDWDTTGTSKGVLDTVHGVVITPVDRPGGGKTIEGKFSGFEPIPGFFNPDYSGTQEGVAMSHILRTWPPSWPDRPDFAKFDESKGDKDGYMPSVGWNGYFGKGRKRAATQESYFWMDDNNEIKFARLYGWHPDTNDLTRNGHALQVAVRGLQWGGDPAAQNTLFWLYNIKNDGSYTYDKAVFALLVGTYVGIDGDEWNDDVSFFDVREAITYTWDFETYVRPSANPRWLPNPRAVGYIAYAFLESPGNGYDGIDNDHDNDTCNTGATKFTSADFTEKTLHIGDKVILINKHQLDANKNYLRTPHIFASSPDTVKSMDVTFILTDGKKLIEGDIKENSTGSFVNPNANDGIDNDLDGLIDENYTVHYKQYKVAIDSLSNRIVLIDTLNETQYIDYMRGKFSEQMIDEKRDDGIDNDKDWLAKTDDVGKDGVANTNDVGEKDGMPTPGEPNFDALDVHESDQLGLTTFWYFKGAGNIRMSDDEFMWGKMAPGLFEVPMNIRNNVVLSGEDGDFMYSSGYFPLLSGKTERFSLALAYGLDEKDVRRIKKVVQKIYNKNYTFPIPPDPPQVSATVDEKFVKLYWGNESEASVDPITKEKDFEGYKIYRSQAYDFADKHTVTDNRGNQVGYTPIAQFDLKDEYYGNFPLMGDQSDLYNGFAPYLGENTGIVHEFTDTTVKKGMTYYYIVTAYDRGRPDSVTYPQENSIQGAITRDGLGKYTFNTPNAVVATPGKKVPGYIAPPNTNLVSRISGNSTNLVGVNILDPNKTADASYTVTFHDTLIYKKFLFNTVKLDSVPQGPFTTSFTVKGKSLKAPFGDTTYVLNSSKFVPNGGDIFNGMSLSTDSTWDDLDYLQLDTIIWRLGAGMDTSKTLLKVATPWAIDYPDWKIYCMIYRAPRDYAIVFSDRYQDSANYLPRLDEIFKSPLEVSKKLNFKVYDITNRISPKQVKFGFLDSGDRPDTLSAADALFISDETGSQLCWYLDFTGIPNKEYIPKQGDTLFFITNKPYTSKDTFLITTKAAKYDRNIARTMMKEIKAVPNPYVATSGYETPPPGGLKGRGERIIKFMNLPPNSKIHIYTSSGAHVRTLEKDGDIFNSMLNWDLRSKEGLEVAYGVYFYVVEAEGISEKKSGKLAIIK